MPLFSIEAECQTLTPTIMSGADNRFFELREASFKGILRFWWRAFSGIQDTRLLFQKEAELFGSTERASPFRLTISKANPIIIPPGKTPDELGWQNGIQYLLFSILKWNRNDRTYYTERPFAQEGLSFHLKFSGIKKEDRVKEILKALWIASMLGGIGSRSRRGAGSFEVTEIKVTEINERNQEIPVTISNSPNFLCFKEVNNPEDIKKAFTQELQKVLPELPPDGLPCFTAYSNNNTSFFLFSETRAKTAKELWNTFGTKFKAQRSIQPQNDARQLHNYAEALNAGPRPTRPPGVWEKHAFGLPIIYHFKRRFGDIRSQDLGLQLKASVYENGNNETRRASPLFISVHSNQKGMYFAIISLFWARFVGDGFSLRWDWIRGNRSGPLGRGDEPTNPDFIRTVLANMGATPI